MTSEQEVPGSLPCVTKDASLSRSLTQEGVCSGRGASVPKSPGTGGRGPPFWRAGLSLSLLWGVPMLTGAHAALSAHGSPPSLPPFLPPFFPPTNT